MTFHVCDNLFGGVCLYTEASANRLRNPVMPRCIKHGALLLNVVEASSRTEARRKLGLDRKRDW